MKLLNARVLGIIGIMGAPWMFIDFINNGLYDRFLATSISGIRNFMFMTGWLCSVVGLYKLEAMGTKRWQKMIVIAQIIFLFLADCWSIFEMFAPDSPSPIYYALNFLWPVAGFCMVITGTVILLAKKLRGWKRYVPLFAGLWFPETVLVYYISQNSILSLVTSGIYSTIVFSLMGFVLTADDYESVKRKSLYKT
jgi:hypothetical protein